MRQRGITGPLNESLMASNLSIYLAKKSDVLESIRGIVTTVI